MSVWAILVAAGRGERLGLDQPKAFAKLGEDPLLAEPLRRLEDSDWIDAIVVVAPPGWEEPAILLAEELGCGKVSACVAGGETRADSVRAGLAEVPDDAVGRARARRGAAAAHGGGDRARARAALRGLGRRRARAAGGRHPEARRRRRRRRRDRVARRALGRADAAGVPGRRAARGGRRPAATPPTAPASSRRAGGRVKVVPGDPLLLKVTTADDLARIASWL